MQMSLCSVMPSPAALTSARWISSAITTLKRKSLTPPPPYSSGTSMPRNPLAPAAVNSSRSTMPACSHRSRFGTTSRSRNVANADAELLVGFVEQAALHRSLTTALHARRAIAPSGAIRTMRIVRIPPSVANANQRQLPSGGAVAVPGPEDRRAGRPPPAQADRPRRAKEGESLPSEAAPHGPVRDIPADAARGVPRTRGRAADHRPAGCPWRRERARSERHDGRPLRRSLPGARGAVAGRRARCPRRDRELRPPGSRPSVAPPTTSSDCATASPVRARR